MKTIIADTSCLIIYDKIKQFEILHKTFPNLIVTHQVAEEFGDLPGWISIVKISDNQQYLKLSERTLWEKIKEKALKIIQAKKRQ